MAWILQAAYAALSLAFALTLYRLVRGPSLADRVVALDMIAYLVIAFAGLFGIETEYGGLLNVALAVGVFAFIGTIAYARYQEAVVALEEEEA